MTRGDDDAEVLDADAALVAGGSLPSARVGLTRQIVIDAAIDYIRHHGLPGLSMRRLGAALEVEAMSLYTHVNGKEDLLDGVVDTLVQQMRTDAEVLLAPEHGWQDFLQRLAHGVRRVALREPQAFPLVASRPPEAPWLRPPLRSIEWVEIFLQGLVDEGFSRSAAVQGYRAFTSFLLGHLLLEVAALGADLGPLDVLDDGSTDAGDLAEQPLVHALRDELSQDHSGAEFEDALENLLDRLSLLLLEDRD